MCQQWSCTVLVRQNNKAINAVQTTSDASRLARVTQRSAQDVGTNQQENGQPCPGRMSVQWGDKQEGERE